MGDVQRLLELRDRLPGEWPASSPVPLRRWPNSTLQPSSAPLVAIWLNDRGGADLGSIALIDAAGSTGDAGPLGNAGYAVGAWTGLMGGGPGLR